MTPDTSLPNLGAEPLYFYSDTTNEPVGPLPLQKLLHLYKVGVISDETLVIEDGGSEWHRFAAVADQDQTVLPPPLPPTPQSLPMPEVGHPHPAQSNKPNFDRLAEGNKPKSTFLPVFMAGLAVLGVVILLAILSVIGFILFIRWDVAENNKAIERDRAEHLARNKQLQPTPTQTSPVAVAQPKATSKPTPTPPKRVAQFETFRLGDFTYEIKEAETTTHLGAAGGTTADAGPESLFVVIHFTIQNETNGLEVVHSHDFRLRDSKGREVGFDEGAVFAVAKAEELFVRQLQPGVAKEAVTAFQIPHSALSGELILIVPEKGFFGSGRVEVVIKPKGAAASPTIAAQIPAPPKSHSDSTGDSLAYKMACLDKGETLPTGTPLTATYQDLLTAISKRKEITEERVANMTWAVVKDLKKDGLAVDGLSMLQAAHKVVMADNPIASQPGADSYSSILAGIAVLMKAQAQPPH